MKKQNKFFALVILGAVVASPSFTQDQPAQAEPAAPAQPAQTVAADNPQEAANMPVIPNDPEAVENSTGTPKVADENLQTVLIDDFETPHGWSASIPLDYGIARTLYRPGSPQAMANDTEQYVLGVKTIFFRRNYGWMSIDRPFPVMIRNIVKNFSLWVVGRNRNHVLSLKVRDLNNNVMRIKSGSGEIRWQGWKKVIFPVLDPVVQWNPVYNRRGLDFLGFHIDFVAPDINVDEATFFYFDYLTATVNFAGTQVLDDMVDNW